MAAAAGLLDMPAFAGRGNRDGFPIGDLRRTRARRDFEVRQHALANDFEMQLSHAGDECLRPFPDRSAL